jgi:hypothetical protein
MLQVQIPRKFFGGKVSYSVRLLKRIYAKTNADFKERIVAQGHFETALSNLLKRRDN